MRYKEGTRYKVQGTRYEVLGITDVYMYICMLCFVNLLWMFLELILLSLKRLWASFWTLWAALGSQGPLLGVTLASLWLPWDVGGPPWATMGCCFCLRVSPPAIFWCCCGPGGRQPSFFELGCLIAQFLHNKLIQKGSAPEPKMDP